MMTTDTLKLLRKPIIEKLTQGTKSSPDVDFMFELAACGTKKSSEKGVGKRGSEMAENGKRF